MALNKEELLDQWLVETDSQRREMILNSLTDNGLFPDGTDFEEEYGLYPEVDDPNFLVKLFHKREFAENKTDTVDLIASCGGTVEFELSPLQRFVSNYLSAKTPYNSALLYHGVGVGKTCAGIASAEAYLHIYPKKGVFVVAPPNIQPNFIKTIFDINNVNIPDDNLPNTHKGCTGNLYLKLSGTEYEKDRKVIEKKINTLIKSRYIILGYLQLYSYIQKVIKRIPPHIEDKEEQRIAIIKEIRKEFSSRFMIIDEAHNLRDIPSEVKDKDDATIINDDTIDGDTIIEDDVKSGKKLTPSLLQILEYSVDLKLVLLSATPMYNSYLEILFILNLLLTNDKKARLTQQDIFLPNGMFKEGGEELLGRVVQPYISYMRGETPFSFPIRLQPTNVPRLKSWFKLSPVGTEIKLLEKQEEQLLKLPFISVSYSEGNYSDYEKLVEEQKGLSVNSIDTLIQAGNWIYPSVDEDVSLDERIRDTGFSNCFDSRSHSLPNFTRFKSTIGKPTWLLDTQLEKYSPKSSFIIKRIRNSEGPIFIYSRFIRSGALPLALALEANGYTLYGRDKGLLVDGVQHPEGRQCAKCMTKERNHTSDNHEFVPAKYVILTGSKDISPNNAGAISSERATTNFDGSDIKVVIGSQVASEGIDLRFIREIYIFDSWYHLNRMEQILGRGIRTCSHVHPNIPVSKRNCTVYLMINTLKNGRESGDMYMYRTGMLKSLAIARVNRVIKRYALDCNLNLKGNIMTGLQERKQINSQQYEEVVDINDKNYTNMCDWMECEYQCAVPVDIDPTNLDTYTYDDYSAKWRESQVKRAVRNLFEKENGLIMIQIDDIKQLMSAIPSESLFSILHDIVDNKSFQLTVGNKKGYLIYKNGYYLFQPNDIENDSIPLALRIANYPIKIDKYTPSKRIEEKIGVENKEEKKVEEKKEGVEEKKVEGVEENKQLNIFWNKVSTVATLIKSGLAKDNDITSISGTSLAKFKENKDISKIFTYFLEMIVWFYKKMNGNEEYRTILSHVFIESVWDNFLQFHEHIALLKKIDSLLLAVAKEQIIGTDGRKYRYIQIQSPYTIKYWCDNMYCKEAVAKILDENDKDELNHLNISSETTGSIYGFIVPIPDKHELIFKTTKLGSKTSEICKNGTTIKPHLDMLFNFGKILKDANISDFTLNNDTFNMKEIKNPIRYCYIKEILLRWMDHKKVFNLRWFYRPIASYKSGHRGKNKKEKVEKVKK